MSGIDDLLGTLHRETTSRLEEQLRDVEREIATRRLISAETTILLYDRIQEVTARILRLLPENDEAPDVHQRDRHELERERRALQREFSEELRSRWRDVQELKREQRTLRDELVANVQRYERSMKDYAP